MSTFSNISETTWPIEIEFHVELPLDRGMKVCSNDLGLMTNMAESPYMAQSLKFFFSGTKRPITLKRAMQHQELKYLQLCSNDDPRLTLTYFTAM